MPTNAPAQAPIPLGNDIRDIKPPVEIPNYWLWVWLGLGVLAAVIAAGLLWRYWQKRRAQVLIVPPRPRPRSRPAETSAGALAARSAETVLHRGVGHDPRLSRGTL